MNFLTLKRMNRIRNNAFFSQDVVIYRDDKYLTLAEVFRSLNLTAYDLSIDTLDMHVSPKVILSYRRNGGNIPS